LAVTNFLTPFLSLQIIVLFPDAPLLGVTVAGLSLEPVDELGAVVEPLPGVEIVKLATPLILELAPGLPSRLVLTVTVADPPLGNFETVTFPLELME
jgi:hypothetical protein